MTFLKIWVMIASRKTRRGQNRAKFSWHLHQRVELFTLFSGVRVTWTHSRRMRSVPYEICDAAAEAAVHENVDATSVAASYAHRRVKVETQC